MFSKFSNKIKNSVVSFPTKAVKSVRVGLVIFDSILCGNYKLEDIKNSIQSKVIFLSVYNSGGTMGRFSGHFDTSAKCLVPIDKKLRENKVNTNKKAA